MKTIERNIESIVNKLDVKQSTGIFHIPPALDEDLKQDMKRWLKRTRNNLSDKMPLVVENERYTRAGVEKKLECSERVVTEKLAKYGLIRPVGGADFSYQVSIREYVEPLSIAQVVSWVFQEPIESIMFTAKQLKSQNDNANSENMERMFNAYKGCSWFENFKKRHVELTTTFLPIVKDWQRIGKDDLEYYFFASNQINGDIWRLFEKGFIKTHRPRKNGIVRMVNNESLAEFIATLHKTEKAAILLKYEQDQFINDIVEGFLENKLKPCLEEKRISPDGEYSVLECSQIINRSYNAVYNMFNPGLINSIESEKLKLKNKVPIKSIAVPGIDLALYLLKNSNKQQFNTQDVFDLFGMEKIDLTKLGMKISENGTYSKNRYVFPMYDFISEKAKEMFYAEKPLNPKENYFFDKTFIIKCKGREMILPYYVISRYKELYDLKVFDRVCMDHITAEIEASKNVKELDSGNELLCGKDMKFILKGKTITSVKVKYIESANGF
ncbi:MAG: hypothetical protein Q8O89_08065 [Nanoarchaeota archaeon]|nr:hypothetical protein [Nanoarchaeota archaeon]